MDDGLIVLITLGIIIGLPIIIAIIYFIYDIIWGEPHREIARLKREIASKEKQIVLLNASKNEEMSSIKSSKNKEIEETKESILFLEATILEALNETIEEIDSINTDRLVTDNKTTDIQLQLKPRKTVIDSEDYAKYLVVSKNFLLKKKQLSLIAKSHPDIYKSFTEIKALLKETVKKKFLIDKAFSNLDVIPYMSHIIADYLTIDFELLAKSLDWGHNQERAKKVASIRQLRAEAKERIESCKHAEYQLKYIINLYPELEELIETDFSEVKTRKLDDLPEYDVASDYLSKEEYAELSSAERNQLALDRYVKSHKKTKWQIGRDYELYVGYIYEQKGYTVDYFGSYMKFEDLGRDLVVHKGSTTRIIQCKYWGQEKLIREKHIAQLYGTAVCYCMEHKLPKKNVKPVLITNTDASDTAKEFAEFLGVQIITHMPMGNFPRIKCNIGKNGERIYHLPFDLQYDSTKIDKPGEFMALTVKEAEDKGFRHSYKWYGA